MIRSMTGYASKTITLTKGTDQKAHIALQLKALNSRYFEANIKLPPALSYIETDLVKLFKKGLVRGYIHFTAYVDNPSIFKGNILASMKIAKSYASALKKIKKETGVEGEPTLEMLIRLPNIFSVEEQGLDKQSAQAIIKAATELVTTVTQERKKEGVHLKKDISNRLAFMKKKWLR